MRLSASTMRRLRWALAVMFVVVAAGPLSLFYAFDFRVDENDCFHIRSEDGEVTGLWLVLSFLVDPLVAAAIAYVAVVLVPPRHLRGTRWRYVLGIPVALAVLVIVEAAFVGSFFLFPECGS